jgi:hypothetical protein
MNRLKSTLEGTVPEGMTVVVTVTAPIRLASKTAAALEDRVQTLLGSKRRDVKDTIHGNDIRIRLVSHAAKRAPKMIGFVHNPETDPLLLLKMTSDLLAAMKPGRKRGLVVTVEGTSCLDAFRYICSQLNIAASFEKILIAFGDGRVEEFI